MATILKNWKFDMTSLLCRDWSRLDEVWYAKSSRKNLTTLPLTVFIQRNFVPDFLQAKCDVRRKSAVWRFWAPFGGLGAMYDDHLRLIGKPISVDWTFFARCYGWGATSEYLLKIGDFAPTGAGWLKISGRSGRPPPTILLRRKLG